MSAKEKEIDYRKLTAPCGLSCFTCHIFKQCDDPEYRQNLADNFGCTLEQAQCRGCRGSDGKMSFLKMETPCRVFACTQKKGVEFCCDCDDFPCDLLHPYDNTPYKCPHNTKLFNNCLIKKMGVEKWGKEKAQSVIDTFLDGEWSL